MDDHYNIDSCALILNEAWWYYDTYKETNPSSFC